MEPANINSCILPMLKMAVLPPDPILLFGFGLTSYHSLCFTNYESGSIQTLLGSTETGDVNFFDLQQVRDRYTLKVGKSVLAVRHPGKILITQEKEGIIKRWDMKNEHDYVLDKQYNCVSGFCKNSIYKDRIFIAQDEGTVDMINLDTFEKIDSFKSEEKLGVIMALEIAEILNQTYILVAYENNELVLWDYLMKKICSRIKLAFCATSLSFDKVSCLAILGNVKYNIPLVKIDKDLSMYLKCEISVPNEFINVVKLRPDRRIIVSGGSDHKVRIFSWRTLRPLAVLSDHRGPINDIAFTEKAAYPNHTNLMAIAGGEGRITVWNIYN